jgi:DNA-binding transcriptional LysR family regulator
LTVRRKIDRFLKENGAAADVVHEFDNIENIKQAVAIDVGIAILPLPTVRREVRDGTLIALPLRGCRFVRPLGIVTKRGHRLGAAARAFLELLQQEGNAARPVHRAAGRTAARVNGHATPSSRAARSAKNGARIKA